MKWDTAFDLEIWCRSWAAPKRNSAMMMQTMSWRPTHHYECSSLRADHIWSHRVFCALVTVNGEIWMRIETCLLPICHKLELVLPESVSTNNMSKQCVTTV